MPRFNCINCGEEKIFYPSQSLGKYCSNKCQAEYQFKTITLPESKEGKIVDRDSLRKVLIHLRGCICEGKGCNISTEWLGKFILLQVDHIDGNPDNNKIKNLRLLCPNCHSQTPTYKGGNQKKLKQDKRNIKKRQKYLEKKSPAHIPSV